MASDGSARASTPAAASVRAAARGPGEQVARAGVQGLGGRGGGAAQRRLERGDGELVHPQRPGERMPPAAFDQVAAAEQQPGLRAAEQLVAARGDQVGPGAQGGGGVRLAGQQRLRGEQAGPDVGDHGHAEAGELGDVRPIR